MANTTEQALKRSIKDIETVLRIEGMDLEIGSRKLLREVISTLTEASAEAQPSQEPARYEIDYGGGVLEFPKKLPNIGLAYAKVTPLYTYPQPSAPLAQAEQIDAYARKLAMHMWREHYLKDSPEFELCDDTLGVMTQIDNMLTGLTRKAERHALTDQEIIAIAQETLSAESRDGDYILPISFARALLSTAPQVEQVEAKEGWISVKDRMPGIVGDDEDGIPCLVARCEDGQYNICIDVWLGTCWAAHEDNLEHYYAVGGPGTRPRLPSYWMPLPAAPSSQKEGEQPK